MSTSTTEADFPGGRAPRTWIEFKQMIVALYGEKYAENEYLWDILSNDALGELKRITAFLDLDPAAPAYAVETWQTLGEWIDIRGHYIAFVSGVAKDREKR